jgi:hypothetical protein
MTDDPDAGGQPTELEVRADQELAAQILAASVLAPLNLLGPAGAVLATISTPIATKIASWVVVKLAERRVKHAAETVLDAAEAAKLPLDEFIDKAVSDDRRHELLARTLFIAQDTALRNKRRALGRALAAGVMGDDAKVDEELLFIRAVADVDEMHIRLLQRMLNPGPIGGGGLSWTANAIASADPDLAVGVLALLGTLELHGLVETAIANRAIPGAVSSVTTYGVTPLGRHFLDRLAADMDTVAADA